MWSGWQLAETPEIRIIDLGSGFFEDDVPEDIAQSPEMKAPETVFTNSFDHRVDLWQAGMLVWFLIFDCLPFCWAKKYAMAEMWMTFTGQDLPLDWMLVFEQLKLDEAADPTSSLHEQTEEEREKERLEMSIDSQFEEKLHDKHLKILLPVIKGLMQLLPSDRISASQALEMIEDGVKRL